MELGLLCTWTGGVLIVAGVPMWRAWLPRNPIWGVKMPIAYRSREHWDQLNRVAGRVYVGWGLAFLGAGAALLATDVDVTTDQPVALLGALAALVAVGHLIRRVGREGVRLRDADHLQRVTLHGDTPHLSDQHGDTPDPRDG